jgi:hypothetical protein
VDRARETDRPDELEEAHDFLLETLEFRRDGLAQVADALPTALSDQDRRQGTEKVTREMQSFLASDVVYYRRFAPSLQSALDEEDLGDEVRIPRSQFLPDIEWLDPRFVSGRISGIRTGRAGDGDAAPGLHGTGVGTVSLAGQTLSPGGAATVRLSGDPKFQVQVSNQGEHTETEVIVRVRIGRGDDAVEVEQDAPSVRAGETETVDIPLDERPPTGQTVPIGVEIEPVPGEKKTDNNKQSFSATFTR